MSQPIILYTSAGVDRNINGFIAAMGHNLGREVQVRPVAALPAPDPLRRQQLRTECLELREDITTTEFLLEQYRCGQLQPDARHEQGLAFDLQALKNRLQGIDTVLGTEKGGADNA